jgi:hypothetical protein
MEMKKLKTSKQPTKTRIFASMTGDYPNIGDAVIRREALSWVSGMGPVATYVGSAPPLWIAQIGADKLGRVYSGKDDALKWLLALVKAKRPVLLYEPGELDISLRQAPRELFFLGLNLVVRAKRGLIVFTPRAVVRPAWLTVSVYRAATALSQVVFWRNDESFSIMRTGQKSPDIAFNVDVEDGLAWAERDLLVVSMRGKRPAPDSAWYDGIAKAAADHGLRILVVSQVREDEARSAEIASKFGAQLMPWGEVNDIDHERALNEVYAQAQLVVSDRLHVLILSSMHGSVPAEITKAPAGKIRTHFENVGIVGVSTDSAKLSSGEVAKFIDGRIHGRPLVVDAIAAAHLRMREITMSVRGAVERA